MRRQEKNMVFSLFMLAEGESEYREAVEWYKAPSVESADRFLVELINALETQPAFYGYYVKPCRRILLKSFPYKIVYEIDGNKVIVHAVFNTGRDGAELRKRLP